MTDATSVPVRENNLPWARLSPPAVDGTDWSQNSQSPAEQGRWNHST